MWEATLSCSISSSQNHTSAHKPMQKDKNSQMEEHDRFVMEGVIRQWGKKYLLEESEVEKTQHGITDEVKQKKDNIFGSLNEAIEKIQNLQSLRDVEMKWNEDLLSSLKVLYRVFHDIKEVHTLSYADVLSYHVEAGKQLLETKTLSIICNVIIDGWRIGFKDKEGNSVLYHVEVMIQALSLLLNCFDSHPDVSNLVSEKDFLETLKNILISYLPENTMEEKKTDLEQFLVNYTLSTFYKISQVDTTIPHLRSLDIVKIAGSYLISKDNNDQLTALALLANIIDEKESKVLQDKQDLLRFLLNKLGLALKNKSQIDYNGWSAWECAMTVRRLARNDANKKILVEIGCLPHLVELAKCGTVQEQREAVGAIWVLAFDIENQKEILNSDLKIVDLLIDLKEKSKDHEVKKAVDGTLWSLRKELQGNEKYKQFGVRSGHIDEKGEKGHILISYNWNHQKMLMTIRDLLKENGYKVWMDTINIGGSTVQDMAEAVEMAHVVLACMSQEYKDNPICRAEVEYAFQLGKKIVPLKMEKDYKPDGWLGFIVGVKYFYDFSGICPFETKFEDLLRGLSVCYSSAKSETKEISIISKIAEDKVDVMPLSVTPMVVARPDHKTSRAALRKWTSDDVDQWLQQHSLPKEQLGQLTGRDIASLVKMKTQAPEFLYFYVYRELKINSLSTLDILTEALESLLYDSK